MKHVVSVSLGSNRRDHEVQLDLLGETLRIRREGTDGDIAKAEARIAELDGHVDCIGLGGIDAYLWVAGTRYEIGDGVRLMQAAHKTPVVDGSGVKNSIERDAIRTLLEQGTWLTPSTQVLLVSALDRFGMAEALAAAGCPCVFGDMIFALGIDYPLRDLAELKQMADRYKSRLQKLPFHFLYPVGAAQEQTPARTTLYTKYYEQADVVAGDMHFIRKYLPEHLDGKVILTNTTTAADVATLAERGARALITTTPVLDGRSFGTNVLEATLVALSGRAPGEIDAHALRQLSRALSLAPTVRELL